MPRLTNLYGTTLAFLLTLAPLASASAVGVTDPAEPDDVQAYVVSGAEVQVIDPTTGTVLSSRTYDSATQHHVLHVPAAFLSKAQALSDHGAGGSSSATGKIRITTFQKGTSTLGQTLWEWRVWTDWTWDRSYFTTLMNAKGTAWKVDDRAWAWDKVANAQNRYYSQVAGYPSSGFRHAAQGEFHGPSLAPALTAYEYPSNTLESHFDGTWEWWTTCCG